jgi:hypothetical protein
MEEREKRRECNDGQVTTLSKKNRGHDVTSVDAMEKVGRDDREWRLRDE